MPSMLYLDAARMGRMAPTAQLALQDFVRVAGEEGCTLYFERFLNEGFSAWPVGYRARFPGLWSWGGVKELKTALRFGLGEIESAHGGYLEHSDVDVHLIDFNSGDYRGRLCNFGQCPKHRFWECRVPDCGKKKFLRQLHKYRFDRARFDAEPKVILMERASGFLVSMPLMEEPPNIEWPDYTDEDLPF